MDSFPAIAAQRRAVADLLDGLTDEQWRTRTLCDAWTVHDMAAHLCTPWEASIWRFGIAMLRVGFDVDRASEAVVARIAERPSSELVGILRANADSRWTPPGSDWHAPLTDNFVHALDICVPLGLDAPGDPAQWPLILEFLVSEKARKGFVAGELPPLRIVATDVGWAFGDGPEVEATAPALALAILRRQALLDQLTGEGALQLAAWASTS